MPFDRLVILGALLLVLAMGCRNPDVYDFDGDGTVDALDCDPNDPEVHPLADEDCTDGVDNDCDGDIDLDDNDCSGDDDTTDDDDDDTADDDDDDTTDDDDDNDTTDDDDDTTDDDDDTTDDDDDTTGDDDDTGGNVDVDGDDWTVAQGDCNDNNIAVNPDAVEILDTLDNDCDGQVDNDYVNCDDTVPTGSPTVVDAIAAAGNGDVICVQSGYYAGTLDFQGKAIRVVGTQGRSITILDASNSDTAVYFNSGEGPATIFEGFTVTNGNSSPNSGGGLYLYGSSPALSRLVITGNTGDSGGGIFLDNSSPTITDVLIDNNTVVWEGGGMFMANSHPILDGVQIVANESGGGGGGVRVYGTSTFTADNLLIEGNLSGDYGGGLLSDDSVLTLTHVTFAGNESATHGGGLFLNSPTGVTSVLTQAAFLDNTADGDGGAIGTYNGDLELHQAVLAGNFALFSGGGVSVTQPGSDVTLSNSILWDNVAVTDGGGVQYVAGTITVQACDLYGNSPVNYGGMADGTGTAGNLSVDPMFIDTLGADPLDWDLHLLALNNTLVDGGDPAISDPDASPSDMGIYGGPDADLWDRDQDGYFEWWMPDPYDGVTSPGLDCDDQDPLIYPGNGC